MFMYIQQLPSIFEIIKSAMPTKNLLFAKSGKSARPTESTKYIRDQFSAKSSELAGRQIS
jgi:hypothetical protein